AFVGARSCRHSAWPRTGHWKEKGVALSSLRIGSCIGGWCRLSRGSPWQPESAETLMAKQQGWLRKKKYADGMTWPFCYQTTRQADGKRVENSKRVGLVADFPTETAGWMEVGRLGLQKYMDGWTRTEPTFKQIAEHWRLHELRKEGIIGRKAEETADRDEHNLDRFILPRWGERLAGSIEPTEVESWFEILASTPQRSEERRVGRESRS